MSLVPLSRSFGAGRTVASFYRQKQMWKRVSCLAALLGAAVATVSPHMEPHASAETLSVNVGDAAQTPALPLPATPPLRAAQPVRGVLGQSGATPEAALAGTAVKQGIGSLDSTTDQACPANMVEVDGEYCPWIEQKCLRWLDPPTKLRCAEFEQTSRCLTKTQRKRFCVDRYEYPNKVGEKPVVMKTWHEAVAACKSEGKRLCKDSEWTLACEGSERLPYPYGYARNADACNIDKPHPEVDEKALGNPATRAAEAARLDQRAPSGAHEACVSPYGVYDMAGNVDEWVVNESNFPYQSGSKGGYWGPVRTRCRPMTTAHYELFSFYQLGFRCCKDAAEPTPQPREAEVARAQTAGARPGAGPTQVRLAGATRSGGRNVPGI
jgi:hypothetical protein